MALLVAKRRAEAGSRYHHLHLYDGGSWDFDFVVPWTKSACRLDADLMIIGQDWASEDYLRRNDDAKSRADRALMGQDAHLATNQNLKRLLASHFGLCFSQTYATNVLVFIKPGGMSSKVPMKDLHRCAADYTLPQLEIVKPRMALCLGAMTFNSVRSALGLERLPWREASIPSAHTHMGPTEIYGVPHTGSWGRRTREECKRSRRSGQISPAASTRLLILLRSRSLEVELDRCLGHERPSSSSVIARWRVARGARVC